MIMVRKAMETIVKEPIGSFMFVPLVGEYGFR
jgi:hypothetical protein